MADVINDRPLKDASIDEEKTINFKGGDYHCKLLQLTFVFIRVGEALWNRMAGTGRVKS